MEDQVQEQQQQGQDNNKEAKKYEQNFKKFMLLFGNDQSVFKNKIPNSQVQIAVDEMLKENREDAVKSFKTKGKALLIKKVEFDKFQKQKQAEFDKAILEKKKELNKEFEALFNEIENVDKLGSEMIAAMKELAGSNLEDNPAQQDANPA